MSMVSDLETSGLKCHRCGHTDFGGKIRKMVVNVVTGSGRGPKLVGTWRLHGLTSLVLKDSQVQPPCCKGKIRFHRRARASNLVRT